MEEYYQRVSDKVLLDHLESKGAVLIEGAKWCGKTTSAKHIAKSVIEMDRPDMTEQYQQMARIKPSNLLEGEVPHLIDEWQIATNIWNAVRYEVDRRGEFGQFILTGSSVPANLDDTMHTGTGRIVRMRMRPMSLFESRDSSGQVSLMDLFDGKEMFFASSFCKKLQSFFAESCDCILQRIAGLHCKPTVTSHLCQPDRIWDGLSCQ